MLSHQRPAAPPRLTLALTAALLAALPAAGHGAEDVGPEDVVRVDAFEMLYAYEVAEVTNSEPVRHAPHDFKWKQSRVWTIFDGTPRSWVETDPKQDFTFTITFKRPVTVAKISVSAGWLQREQRFQPFRWWLATGGSEETRRIVLCTGEVQVEGEHTAWLTSTNPETSYTFGIQAIDESGQPAPEGAKSVHLIDVNLFAPLEEAAYVWASPAAALCFDKSYLPYAIGAGETFEMTAWKIANTGQRRRDTTGIRWSSSEPKVARVDKAGVVKALQAGQATIRASLPNGSYDEVPVKVIAADEAKPDLDLIWVERWIRDKDGNLVKRDWDAEVTEPQPGESLVWQAHVINAGEKTCTSAGVYYSVDGLASSTAAFFGDMPPAGPLVETGEKVGEVPLLRHTNEQVIEFLEMPFDGKRHVIEVKVAPTGGEEDANPDNNTLTVWSDAITFGYYVSEMSYHGYGAIQGTEQGEEALPETWPPHLRKAEWGPEEWATCSSTSYDRLQRIVRVFNRQFEMSKHPLTPNGITERINGEMFIIPDQEEVLETFGINGVKFGGINRTIDLIWGHVMQPDHTWTTYAYEPMRKQWMGGSWPFIDTPLIHEVSHARYLIDLYGSNIWGRDIHVLNPDGSRAFPDEIKNAYDFKARFERHTAAQYEKADKHEKTGHLRGTFSGRSMMEGGYQNGWCEHSAYAWERIRGRRARAGTWNASPPLGEFLNAIPDTNVLLIQRPDGTPCAGARIEVFQCVHDDWSKGIYAQLVDNVVDIEKTTDAEGKADLGPSPFATANPEHKYQYKGVYGYNAELNAVLRITWEGKIFYKFLTAFDSNLGYWYKYGLGIEGWPYPRVKEGSELTYVYTIDPDWTAQEEETARSEVPRTY